jgi:hypothetical protein
MEWLVLPAGRSSRRIYRRPGPVAAEWITTGASRPWNDPEPGQAGGRQCVLDGLICALYGVTIQDAVKTDRPYRRYPECVLVLLNSDHPVRFTGSF